MKLYPSITHAVFIERPNRFVARVLLHGQEEIVHVKNTGRCRELLQPGCTVYLSEGAGPARKTRYDLVAVEKQRRDMPPLLVNMDSQAPNKAAEEWLRLGGPMGEGQSLFDPAPLIRPESRYGHSRFDFFIEQGKRKAFMEVKGCTLEEDGHARFPDAPTERGRKHVLELMEARQEGYEAYILFVIQMEGIRLFSPNDETDPAFGQALRKAAAAGVQILAMECSVTPDCLTITRPVKDNSHALRQGIRTFSGRSEPGPYSRKP